MLRRLGFTFKPRGGVALLEGCEGLDSRNNHIVGETIVHWNTVRWVVGYGQDDEGRWIGMWDFDVPGPAVRRWPRSPEGAHAASQAQFELVGQPILTSTRLLGQRRWAVTDGDPSNAPAVFYHFSPERRLSIHLAVEPPIAWYRSKHPGYGPHMIDAAARAVGFEPFDLLDGPILTTTDDADRCAWGLCHRRLSARWEKRASRHGGTFPTRWIVVI